MVRIAVIKKTPTGTTRSVKIIPLVQVREGPSTPNWDKEISKSLWLPNETDCNPSELKGSSEKILKNSWFSVSKISSKDTNLHKVKLPKVTSSTSQIHENSLRIRKYQLYLTKEMIRTYKVWFRATRWVYNKCVEYYHENLNEKISLKYLRDYTINSKTINHEPHIMNLLSQVPYDVKDSAIRDFMNALIIQKKLVKEGKRKFFSMKFRSHRDLQSLGVSHSKIKDRNGILTFFPTFLGRNAQALRCREKIPKITHDVRLSWNTRNIFILHVPTDVPVVTKSVPKGNICSIDPGEVIFASVYGSDGCSYLIGANGSKKVDKIASIASRMRNGIKRTLNPDGTKEYSKVSGPNSKRTRKHLKDKAKNLETKAKNLISDIHKKTVKFLTKKYDTIIIPKFETQSMIKRLDSQGKWKRKIGKGTSRRLIRWSHYNFRELLKAKGGNRVIVGTEEWTSKTCGNCFTINNSLGGSREFNCSNCGLNIHRDINGARNIMILNWDKIN